MVKPTTKVYKKQTIEGFSIPAIIRNGSYFFVDLSVYENGRVDCWNFQDFDHFINDVNRGWVSVSIPDNNAISIHGLGSWTIQHGSWLYSSVSFIEYVRELIKELNPKWENIYKYSEKTINGVRVGENGSGTVYKEHKAFPNDIFPNKIDGRSVNLFYKIANEYYLTKVNVFADGMIQLSRIESPIELNLEKLEQLINEGTIATEIPLTSRVHIYGLGSFLVTKTHYVSNCKDKFIEIKDILRDLNGQPSTIDLCRQAFEGFLKSPNLENKQKLKTAYENVPDHQKMHVGDMDTKDIAVRMIIYGDQEIEKWSHYQVAKFMNEKLPTISVPKPKDENNNA